MRIYRPGGDNIGPPPLDPKVKALLVLVGLKILLATFLIAAFIDELAAFIYLAGWSIYGGYKLIRWALKEDATERERRQVEDSLWQDLREYERKLLEVIKPDKKEEPAIRNSQGEPMYCILCDRYTNAGGRYCDDHDGVS